MQKDEKVGEASDGVVEVQGENPDLQTLFRRFWKVAAPYWSSDDKVQARLQLAGVFALTLATTGISVGFSFLGRDFYNALASKFMLYLWTLLLCVIFHENVNTLLNYTHSSIHFIITISITVLDHTTRLKF